VLLVLCAASDKSSAAEADTDTGVAATDVHDVVGAVSQPRVKTAASGHT